MADLTLHSVDMGAALPALMPAIERGDTTAGAVALGDMLQGCEAFELRNEEGQTACHYALKISEHGPCRVLWVMAAAGGLPGRDVTLEGIAAIERQARAIGAAQIAITTKRRGLVKKLTAAGFDVTGITIRKRIK